MIKQPPTKMKDKPLSDEEIIEEVLNKFDKEKIEASMRETPNCYGWCFTYGEVKENILPEALTLQKEEFEKMINEWYSKYGYGDVDGTDIKELLTKIKELGK